MVFLCVVCVRLLALVSCYHQRCCVCSSPTVQFWSSLSDYFPMFSKKETLSLEKSFWTWKILFSWFWAHHGTSTFLSQHLHGIDKTQSFFSYTFGMLWIHYWVTFWVKKPHGWIIFCSPEWGCVKFLIILEKVLRVFADHWVTIFSLKTLDEATPQTFLNLPCVPLSLTLPKQITLALRLTYLWKWIRSTFCKEL